ncbi:MAG TPA: TIGR03435 family protein [Bryobacteraceae bacterium]|nr:TIGR03435 family protein [Bryobacteraceae bacterium]
MAITAIGFVLSAGLFAQTAAFDVATIKLSAPEQRGSTLYTDVGGKLSLEYMTLKDLIGFAWDVRDFQISGGPKWIDSTHYDVNAKSQTAAGLLQLRPMVQPLLAERFHLAIHKGTKDLVYYALTIGKNEPKLTPSQTPSPQLHGHGGELIGQGISISLLTGKVAEELGRPVLDHTGLTGKYDINLRWTPDDGEQKTDPSRPSLFTAVQEQLGLKLESQKGPVEILIVDRAERPSEN